uniref:FAM192A/Fyv6 N-terminal domain-containing protein n=1 Tax=Globodera rostochiensis TaxID=31243 RepID=A0A914I8Y4_GLORO
MNFVSEEELKKKRESEGDQPEGSEPSDNRTLYVRLKEQRDKKQLEYDETHAFKNQFRGIDEAESDFLTQVDRAKTEQEIRKRKEEQELLQLAREQMHGQCSGAELPPVLLEKPQKAVVPSSGGSSINKQAALVASFVRKRPLSTDGDPNQKQSSSGSTDHKSKKLTSSPDDSDCPPPPPSTNQRVELQSHCKLIGVLPGMPNYSDSSDEAGSSSNSESLESELPCVAVFAGKGASKQQGNGC